MNLAHILKKARLAIGFSCKEMACAVGKKPGTYRTYEDGRAEPSLATLLRIADLAGVTLDELVRGDIKPSKDIRFRYERLNARDKSIVDAVLGNLPNPSVKNSGRKIADSHN